MASDRGNLSRKMAAIVHADIAGSTALVQLDEALAHERTNDAFGRFSESIGHYGGTVHEIRGDALVAEFSRASDAVCAALAFQESHSQVLDQLDDEIIPKIRIGVSLGEAIFSDGQVTGAGVVLAQRVEQLAEPGGLSITGAVHEVLPQHLPIDQDDLGDQEVKGFNEPVRVYTVRLKKGSELPEPVVLSEAKKTSAVQWLMVAAVVVSICGGGLLAWLQPWKPDFEPASVEKMALPLPDKPSIAVLPFDNLSDDEKLDSFVNGLTENVTSALAKISGIFVIAGNSAATYAGKSINVKQVAEDLGVQYVLEGSVQKSGDRLRITANLVDAIKGHHLWAHRFDRHAEEVFAVQDEITKQVFTELQVELTEGEHARIAAGGTDSLEAWLLRIEAYNELIKYTRESQMRALELYKAAHEADPNWAWPVAGFTWVHSYLARRGWGESREESIRLGIEAAERAIALQPDEWVGYGALANMMFIVGDTEKAIEMGRKSVELAPGSFAAIANFAFHLSGEGRGEEAVELFERAARLSPKHPWWVDLGHGFALHLIGRKDDAIEVYQKGIDAGAISAPIRIRLAAVHADLGQMDKAKAAIEDALRLDPSLTIAKYFAGYPVGDREAWYRNLLVQAGLPEHPPLELPERPSIAVLPFTNIGDDPQQEYFADGMTDDLITELSKISSLLVIARNSVFVYKDKPAPLQQMARELGVRYLLEGSVRRTEDRLRINAQLIDGTTGGHVWAERYDGSFENVFALQDKVTRRIVTTLKVQLTPDEKVVSAGRDTENVAAYDAFLKGWTHLQTRTPEDAVKAIPFFNEAIELDPNYGDAYAALAQIYWDYSNDEKFNSVVDPGVGPSYPTSGYDSHLKALRFLRKLRKVRANTPPQAHMLAARMLQRQRRFDEAMQEARRSVALGPNDPLAYEALIENLIYAGEAEEALTLVDESMPLDPKVPGEKLFLRGMAYYTLGRLEEAISSIDAARSHNPNQTRYAAIKAAALAELGRLREAEVSLAEYLSSWTTYSQPDLNWTMYYWPFQSREVLERLADSLTRSGLPLPIHRYYLAASQDRLKRDEIESLLSNKTMIGGNRGYYSVGGFFHGDDELEATRDEQLQILTQSTINYFRSGGESRIENNLLCDPWDDLGDYCVAIYRNPNGTQDAKNEYLFFTFMTTFSFSVFDSI